MLPRTVDKASSSTFVFLPKVGYALMLSDMLGFWFRGGPGLAIDTTHNDRTNDLPKTTTTLWLLSLDALFVVTPVQHVGFYVGPGFDFSFTGRSTTTQNQAGNGTVEISVDASYTKFGLGFGDARAYFVLRIAASEGETAKHGPVAGAQAAPATPG